MSKPIFKTENGLVVPSVDEGQMREVDRIASEDFGLTILQMMENAGRNLALSTIEAAGGLKEKNITILAGSGGNGGGGLSAARHLHNHGFQIQIFLSKSPEAYRGPAAIQLNTLQRAGVTPQNPERAGKRISIPQSGLIIDALIGYSLKGAPRGSIKDLIRWANQSSAYVVSLDLPSGVDATTGETPGDFIRAARTVTLALPKPGLANQAAGDIFLADIGIPPEVYQPLGIKLKSPFGDRFLVKLKTS